MERYSIKEHFIITVVFILITGILWYYNPISETMTCDSNFNCKIEHVYFGDYKNTDDINIRHYWTFNEVMSGFAGYQERHIAYNTYNESNQLFLKKGVCSFKEGDVKAYNECKANIKNSLNDFNTYMKNPENGIVLKSDGGINYLKKYFSFFFILYVIGMLIDNPITIIYQLIWRSIMVLAQQVEEERENRDYYGVRKF